MNFLKLVFILALTSPAKAVLVGQNCEEPILEGHKAVLKTCISNENCLLSNF